MLKLPAMSNFSNFLLHSTTVMVNSISEYLINTGVISYLSLLTVTHQKANIRIFWLIEQYFG